MAIDGMNHFTVLTKDLDATRNFYCGILGLKEGYRPPLGFPGTWLYAGAQPVLHVVAGRPLPDPPASGGAVENSADNCEISTFTPWICMGGILLESTDLLQAPGNNRSARQKPPQTTRIFI